MAFNKDGLVRLGGKFDGGNATWMYVSTDDIATVNTAGYFSAGYGLKEDDLIIVTDKTNHLNYFVSVKSDLDVTDGLLVTATDTD